MANFAQDAFTGGSGSLSAHTDDLGNSWTKLSGSGDLLLDGSGHVVVASGNTFAFYSNGATPPTADYTVSAEVTINGASEQAAVLARIVDASNYYYAGAERFGNTFRIVKKVAGTETTLATTASSSNGTTTLAFSVSGSSLTLIGTGANTVSLTATDGTFTLAGTSGVIAQNMSVTDFVDNFAAVDIGVTFTLFAQACL